MSTDSSASMDEADTSASHDQDGTVTTRPERGRRPLLWLGLAVFVIAGAILTSSLLAGEGEEATVESAPNTAEVVRADLADETIYDATLGRPVAADITAGVAGTVTWVPESGTIVQSGEPLFAIDGNPVLLVDGQVPAYRDLHLGETKTSIPAGGTGVLTWLAPAGAIIESGEVVAHVNEEPLVVLEGDLPMYRALRRDVEGQDVLQLETALVALGYDPDGTVTVDEEFTSATESMVERWQEALGVDETGRVDVGDLIFAPLPGQVLTADAAVGSTVAIESPILTMSAGAPLAGEDVSQLEEALSELGFSVGAVDGVYDLDLASAVVQWTEDEHQGTSGYLPVGSIVFNDGALRTASVYSEAGTAVTPSSPVISAADLETIVRLDLPATDQDLISVGSNVVIVLPDRSEIDGTVTYVSLVAETGEPGQTATFPVEIALDDPSVAEGLDEAPVDVRIVSEGVEDVLAVPVSALLALAEGGYAVEVIGGDATRLVAVEPGFFADGMVEIAGDVEAGDVVAVP